jgi:hypothetical protein
MYQKLLKNYLCYLSAFFCLIDEEPKAFYNRIQKDRNFSVVDQRMAYLNLMLNNKADLRKKLFSVGMPLKYYENR